MAQKTVPFTFGAITVNERKMKTYKVIVHMPNRDYNPKGHDYKVRASSIDNLRKNLIKRFKTDTIRTTIDVASEDGKKWIGTLKIIYNMDRSYQVFWDSPEHGRSMVVNMQTGRLKG